jgi:hypothetical protein
VAGGFDIVAEIDGRPVPRREVLAWEARRAAKVCRKLGIPVSEDLKTTRKALVARKLELGQEALERQLERELRLSAWGGRAVAAVSRGRRRLCTIELRGSGGSAEAMPAFYKQAMEAGDEAALLAACPDHYVLRAVGEGRELVVETMGGSPLAAGIFLADAERSEMQTQADPSFPVQWVAVGRIGESGPVAGAIRHQFRDGPDGFRARLTGEFPIATPPWLIREHRWHLACEFSNWIEAANAFHPGSAIS